jgi:S1-C subfamily serine protease
MKGLIRSPLASALVGGAVVAGTFLALGVTGHRTTETIVQQAPVAAAPASNSSGLTPHDIYMRDAPGVVFVRAYVVEQVQDPFDLFPQQQSSTSTGSGFLIDRAGHVLTNYHVIEGANRHTGVTVRFEDKISRPALVVGEDPNNDLALLKVSTAGLPSIRPLALGDSTTVRVGDPTLAIGNPFGLDRTLTSGIVSALQRQIQAPNGFAIDNVIQTDAPINPGNSGGPLLDATGRVIGINSQIATGDASSSGSVGIAFAVPVNTAKEFLPRLSAGGVVKLAYLGVSGVPATGARPGLVIAHIQPGGPAAQAGLRRGDEIQAVDGRHVGSMSELQGLIETRTPGQAVTLRAVQAGRQRNVRVQLTSRPSQ